jgi:hypothetical protein
MHRLRTWFLAHWFAGVFAIIGVLWVAALVAYFSGARGISFGNRYTGRRATIDFGRQHERTVLGLRDDAGLELRDTPQGLRGTVVALKPGIPVVGAICGAHQLNGGIAVVEWRQGDWFFRRPVDPHQIIVGSSGHREEQHGAKRTAFQTFMMTVAYNRATGERVVVDADEGKDAQEKALTKRGLEFTKATRLTPELVKDLSSTSLSREGCLVFNAAFMAAGLLWLLVGGLAVVVVAAVKRRRA